MKAGKKVSHNQARKRLYAEQADKGSRNEATIWDAPIVGAFVEVVDKERFGDLRLHKIIVHDTARAVAGTSRKVKRKTDARKIRRQLAAWGRCRRVKQGGAHVVDGAA